jgi:hypothetical protein
MEAFAAGLLDEVEEARFRKHLTECAECEKQWRIRTEAQDPDVADGGHIPSAVIARWDRAVKTLRGLERAMVRQHLQRCSQCRQDLEVLGFEPTIEVVPELEMQTEIRPETSAHFPQEPSLDEAAASPLEGVIKIIQQPRRSGRQGWWSWAFAGWAVVATAAAILLVVGRETVAPPVGPAGSAALPWVQPASERGAPGAAGLELTGREGMMILAVPVPPGTPAGKHAVIQVFAPDGKRLTQVLVAGQDLGRRAVMIPLTVPDGFPPGAYRVLFWKGDPAEPYTPSVESWFEIRLGEP